MSPASEYDTWLVKIERARMLRETDSNIPMLRVELNTFDKEDGRRIVSFHMPRGEARPVVDQMQQAFGVESVIGLRGKWATILCPREKGTILGLKPANAPCDFVRVMSRSEAMKLTRMAAN